MQMALRFNTRDFEESVRRLRENAPAAIRRALDRAIDSAKTAMVHEIAVDTGMKSSDLRDRLWKAWRTDTPGTLAAQLLSSPTRIPLVDFNAKGPEPSRGKGRGVTARLPGGAGRYPNAFLATMRSGHRGVFQRQTKARLPIYELHGPSIMHVADKFAHIGLERGREQLVKNLQSELRFVLRRGAA